MDWDETTYHTRRRSSRSPRSSASTERNKRPREGYKVDFPNYLNPYRQSTNQAPTEKQPSKQVANQPISRTEDKEAYYQKLRQDIKDYRKYRNHQPFRRTEVPSIWQNTERSKTSRVATEQSQVRQPKPPSQSKSVASKPASSQSSTAIHRTTQNHQRAGRSIDFSGIKSREPEISEQTFKQRYVTEDRDLPPYLKKETNGENKRHEH